MKDLWRRIDDARRLFSPYLTRRNLGIAIAAVALFDITLYGTCGLRGCPDPARLITYQPGGASTLLDRNHNKFADLAPVERKIVKLSTLPDYLPNAFVAVEDRRFFQHHGVDWRRVVGAGLHNIKSGSVGQGSSTITMQLARNIFADRLRGHDKSLRRKIFEARVARKIERKFTKPQILELYLNHIYFGGGAYGVAAASHYYFDKSAAALDLEDAALLAALPKAPSGYNPRAHPEKARDRRDLVLVLMKQQQLIDGARAERATAQDLGVTREPPEHDERAPFGAYFKQVVRDQLEDQLGDEIYRRKLSVYTTLDSNAQRAAEEELEVQLRAVESGRFGRTDAPRYSANEAIGADGPEYLQDAVVVMESLTGDVIALVGGRDFRQSRYNRALLARRQAGSAFKPFVYGAAIAEGYVPSQPIMDTPYRLVVDGTAWEPSNYDHRFNGPVSLREALVFSRNVPSVRLAESVGEDNIADFAHEAGITSEVANTPMIALGITEVTPLELVHAYGSFAGMGTRAEPRFIDWVENEKGDVVWRNKIRTERTIKPAVGFVMTDMLADAVDYGTGKGVREGGYAGPAAGKTGTTSDGADVWFVGYTPDLVAGVWIGYDRKRNLPDEASGGSVAAPAWGRMMRRIYDTRPMPQAWIIPRSVAVRDVDPASGLVLKPGCRPLAGSPRQEVFLDDSKVESVCPAGEPESGNIFKRLTGALAGLFRGKPDNAAPAGTSAAAPVDEDLGTAPVSARRSVRSDDGDREGRKRHGKSERGKGRGNGKNR